MSRAHLGSATIALAAGTAGLLALSGCGSDSNNDSASSGSSTSAATIACAGSGSLAGAGSTFQKNIQLQWIKDYGSACSGVKINYDATGSGAGIQSFSSGLVDYAGSDSLLKDTEQPDANKRCGTGNTAIHIPITAGAVVLTYNLSGVDTLKLSAPVIAGIFEGQIKTWNDPKIAADNSGVSLPSTAIQPVHRSDSSGTTDIFSKYLTADAGSAWTLGTGKTLDWPGGQGAKGSDGVTAAVKSSAGGIGYTELSYAKANSLPMAEVKNPAGEFTAPTADAVSKSLATAKVDTSKGDVRVSTDFTSTAPGVYPISAVSYVIVCNKGNKNPAALKGYLTYASTTGQGSADGLGFAPLPDAIASAVSTEVAGVS